jgi:CheY-like chemotaxis protein
MKRILCVDDEPEILEIIKFDLELDGYTVVTASSVEEALRKLSEQAFDLVLSDVKMPGLDGKDFARALRARGDKTPFAFLTGFSDVDQDFMTAFQVSGLIAKPYDASAFSECIKSYLSDSH